VTSDAKVLIRHMYEGHPEQSRDQGATTITLPLLLLLLLLLLIAR
jgi:hypothetical protein